MWIILTEPNDQIGTWLTDGLRRCTTTAVHHLTTRDLRSIDKIETDQDNGASHFRIHLSSGFVVDSRTMQGVVNRVAALPPGIAARRDCPERMVAVRNFGSPVWRLLAGAPCPILNRPTAQGLSGDYRLASEWAVMARDAGLPPLQWIAEPNSDMSESPSGPGRWSRVAVIGTDVIPLDSVEGKVPARLQAGCRGLAEAANLAMLGIDLVQFGRSGWSFAGIDLRPDLSLGGEAALAAVIRALGAIPERRAANRAAGGQHVGFGVSRLFRMGFALSGTAGRQAMWRFLHP